MHCTILGMVKTTLFGGIGGKLREKMSNGYRNCNYHLFSFYFVKYLLGVPLELFLHKVLLPVGYVVILSIPLSYLVYMQIYNFHFIFILVVILLLNGVIVMFAGINKNERRQICNMVYNLKLKRV